MFGHQEIGQSGMRKLRVVLIPGVTIATVMTPGDSQLRYSIFDLIFMCGRNIAHFC